MAQRLPFQFQQERYRDVARNLENHLQARINLNNIDVEITDHTSRHSVHPGVNLIRIRFMNIRSERQIRIILFELNNMVNLVRRQRGYIEIANRIVFGERNRIGYEVANINNFLTLLANFQNVLNQRRPRPGLPANFNSPEAIDIEDLPSLMYSRVSRRTTNIEFGIWFDGQLQPRLSARYLSTLPRLP